jgi:hypothetical protein
MRKVSSVFLVGLCVGAIGAIMVTVRHETAVDSPRPLAGTGTVTTMSAPPTPTSPAARTTPGTSTPAPSPKPHVDPSALDDLVPGGQVSAVVFDRTTGKTLLAAHPDRTYTSASLVKLFIALEVLDRDGPSEVVLRMLSRSDDDLASRLWSSYGGPQIVSRWAKTIGLHDTRPPADPGRWGDTEITAPDMVLVYRYLTEQAAASGRTTILNALRDATERGSDGFRQYFGIPDAAKGHSWAVKQGWSCCRPTRMLHTTGLVDDDRYIVVVLTEHPRSVSDAVGSLRVTKVATSLLSLIGG